MGGAEGVGITLKGIHLGERQPVPTTPHGFSDRVFQNKGCRKGNLFGLMDMLLPLSEKLKRAWGLMDLKNWKINDIFL